MAKLKNISEHQDPIVKIMSLTIQSDRSYQLYVLGEKASFVDMNLSGIINERNLEIVS